MWIKRQSQLLLVRVSGGGLRLVIPIPLFVLDLALAACCRFPRLLESLTPRRPYGWRQFDRGKAGTSSIPTQSLQAAFQLFREMRKFGRFRLAEVQSGRIRVFIDFY